jgi:16S rRNA (cytidine1402-2'-O)-methyltransferase
VVIVVGAPPEEAASAPEDVDAALVEATGRLSPADAAREVAAATGLPRRELYRRALALKGR